MIEKIDISGENTACAVEMNFVFECERLGTIVDRLVSVSPFVVAKSMQAGQEVFGFKSFSLTFDSSTRISVEQEIMKVLESFPLGIDMRISEHVDREEDVFQVWKIQKARMNSITFGGFRKGSNKIKTVCVEFQAKEVELETIDRP